MKIVFYILSAWTIISGIAAISLRNIVHCALALIAFFAGIAGIFFSLHAEFLGAVQVIVYVGAVAVLILFAIMLTRHVTGTEGFTPFSGAAVWGWIASIAILIALFYSLQGYVWPIQESGPQNLGVADIGNAFMTRFAIPFEVISLLLTAALVGAVVIALEEPKGNNLPPPKQ
jgi:NADH-quinone oxidoreductase subunit J